MSACPLRSLSVVAVRRVRDRIGAGPDGRTPDAGFTLIEVIVSFVIFSIVATASVAATINTTKASAVSRNQVVATDLAQQDLQNARAVIPRSSVAAATASPAVGSTTYTVTRAVPTRCPAVTTATGTNKIVVTTTVTWRGASSPVVLATVLSC